MFEDFVFLGIGTNIGDRLKNLHRALTKISDIPTTYILDYSSIYETEPVGYLKQGHFLNMVARISTWLPPFNFLSVLQQIENEMGRMQEIKWGPRIIDIDILFWGKKKIKNSVLTVPHPENQNRSFVKIPMSELAPAQFYNEPQKAASTEVVLHTSKSKIEF